MADIDKIKHLIDVYRVALRSVPDLKDVGRSYIGLCPFHKEKTPSFHVNKEGYYKCFGCDAKGDMFRFVMETEHVPFPEAIKIVCEASGIPLSDTWENNSEYKPKARPTEEIFVGWSNEVRASANKSRSLILCETKQQALKLSRFYKPVVVIHKDVRNWRLKRNKLWARKQIKRVMDAFTGGTKTGYLYYVFGRRDIFRRMICEIGTEVGSPIKICEMPMGKCTKEKVKNSLKNGISGGEWIRCYAERKYTDKKEGFKEIVGPYIGMTRSTLIKLFLFDKALEWIGLTDEQKSDERKKFVSLHKERVVNLFRHSIDEVA